VDVADRDYLRELCDLLRESGAVVTFSRHCCSGIVHLIGKRCECWRCREARGEECDEALAAAVSAEAQVVMREWVRRQFEAGA
jgi:hypothetical protein